MRKVGSAMCDSDWTSERPTMEELLDGMKKAYDLHIFARALLGQNAKCEILEIGYFDFYGQPKGWAFAPRPGVAAIEVFGEYGENVKYGGYTIGELHAIKEEDDT